MAQSAANLLDTLYFWKSKQDCASIDREPTRGTFPFEASIFLQKK